ncbi:hypothetical protein [Sphingomonas sp. NPDC079357]|uniref:hypothetical protein n=1 Tax=Sphingomonas sp. NPDC079357 TaxID=3364518 RepID=UPI00384D1161
MEEESARYRCEGDDGSSLTVMEYRHVGQGNTDRRRYPGARRLILSTGEPVRYIDAVTFEVIGTGELVRRWDRS